MSKNILNDNCGAIYLAFGYDYLIMCLRSAITLNNQHPDLPITIVTNLPVNERFEEYLPNTFSNPDYDLVDNFITVEADTEKNRDYKTSIIDYSPYEKTVFLDCDTIIKKDISTGFNILRYFDLALVSRPLPSPAMVKRWEGNIDLGDIYLQDSTTFYSGVLFFNKKSTKNFFQSWGENYKLLNSNYDQFSLLQTIYECDIKILPLPVIWNTMLSDVSRYRFFDLGYELHKNIKILHHNHQTLSQYRGLQKLENIVGPYLLNLEDDALKSCRQKFNNKFSIKNAIKGELSRNRMIKQIFYLLS